MGFSINHHSLDPLPSLTSTQEVKGPQKKEPSKGAPSMVNELPKTSGIEKTTRPNKKPYTEQNALFQLAAALSLINGK